MNKLSLVFRWIARAAFFGCLGYMALACQPPNTGGQGTGSPNQQLPDAQDLIKGASEVSTEFKELSKPNKVQVWVDGLVVKSQPGKDMPKVATLRDGDVLEFCYQRTIRKSEFTLRGQRYYQPWILVKLKDGTLGWVHEGGIRYLEPEIPGFTDGKNSGTRGIEDGIPESNDWIIVPGKRVGSIKFTTSEQDLVRLFGEEGVSRGKVQASASKQEDCTVVMAGKDEEIRVVWKNDDRTRIKSVYVLKQGSQWHLREGVHVGTSLSDLTKLNEAPISFYGFKWEYSGTISSYRSGILAKYEKFFYLTVVPAKGTSTTMLADYAGDRVFSSNTEGVESLNLEVDKIVVYLD